MALAEKFKQQLRTHFHFMCIVLFYSFTLCYSRSWLWRWQGGREMCTAVLHMASLCTLYCSTFLLCVLFQELVVALAGLVEKFEQQFMVVAARISEEEKAKDRASPVIVAETAGGWTVVSQPGLGITLFWSALL